MKTCRFCPAVMHFSPRLPYAESFAYIFIFFSKWRKEENIFKHTDYLVSWWHYLKHSPLWYTMSLNVRIVSTCATCLYSMHWGLYRSHKKCDNTCEIYVTVMWWYKVYIPGVCGFISRWRICNINQKTASPKSLLASIVLMDKAETYFAYFVPAIGQKG